ncbi:MAG: PEP-CTERM sorting domain-containing protein [Myxococcota bacterium]
MRLASLVCLVLLSLAGPAFAVTNPFSYSVQDFSIPERGIGDDFEDGSLGSDWFNTFGTAAEGGGGVTFSDPGQSGFLDPLNVDSDSSGISGFNSVLNNGGSFTATSIWLPEVPAPGTSYTMALGSFDLGSNLTSISIGISNTLTSVANRLDGTGFFAGLQVNMLQITRDASNQVTSFDVSSNPFVEGDIAGAILLMIAFDDLTNEVQASYSLDNGTTTNAFAPVNWTFPGGSFSLLGTSTVPEPSTALLVMVGLAGIALRRR